MQIASRPAIQCIVKALLVAITLAGTSACATRQQVVFAPSIATLADDGSGAVVIQGRVFEAPDSLKRKVIIDTFPLHITPSPDRQDPVFRERAGLFWSDSDSMEPVSVRFGARVLVLPQTDSGGFFSVQVPLTSDETAQLKRESALMFRSLATDKTPAASEGVALLVPETGLTVITDVDDTIKVTEITNKAARDANTFVNPFIPVPFMPELYTSWQRAYGPSIHFHVVSAGPWQLHEPLRKFTEGAGFPPFTWHMRSMKITDLKSLAEALDPEVAAANRLEFKVKAIREFMQRFTLRHVVLVGDSGEQDPEVYAQVLAEFPDRVDWVLIRDVSNDTKLVQRNRSVLFNTPERAAKLRVFTDPTPATRCSSPSTIASTSARGQFTPAPLTPTHSVLAHGAGRKTRGKTLSPL
jgi:phosphatidate phosphatase APP1